MIHKSVLLHCDRVRAFELFTERAGEWWPLDRRHTGDRESEIRILATGRFYERARDGREVELGRVKVWEPPSRLVLDFYPGTDADHPTEVTVGFAVEGEKTRITIDHGPTEASAELYKQRAVRFEDSWERVLSALAEASLRSR